MDKRAWRIKRKIRREGETGGEGRGADRRGRGALEERIQRRETEEMRQLVRRAGERRQRK